MKYVEAIREALRSALDSDPDTILLGTDIGRGQGVFRATRGLIDQFGPNRVIDLPIAEMGTLGLAVGAALTGLRPVVELMYVDFIGVCLDPLLNQAAKIEFMSGGQVSVPLVLRTQFGAGGRSGAQHSQSLESLFAAIPGLKVVCPSTPRDAYGLLLSSIRDPGPVVFLENRRLYGQRDDALGTDELGAVPLGVARVVKPGEDLTCVSYSRMVHECVAVAEQLDKEESLSVEVIDLRTIFPIDRSTIEESVRETSRLLVVHEATVDFGVASEIAGWAADSLLTNLDAPVKRLGAPRSPVPFSPPLEDAYLPGREQIAQSIRELASW